MTLPKISPVTRTQWGKVLKAVAYSFVSAAGAALVLIDDFNERALVAVLVAGLNGALVTIKQLFSK